MKTSADASSRLAVIIVIVGMPLALAVGVFSLDDSAISLGLKDVVTDYAVGFLWALIIVASIQLWPVPSRHVSALSVLWLARIAMTLGLMLFYEGNYGLDAAYYFAVGSHESAPWELLSFGAGTDNMLALVAFQNMVLPASYHATKVTCALMGLVAVYLFYRAACTYRGKDDVRLLYVLGLFPSIIFWGSILGKDPITLLGIAIFTHGAVRFAVSGGMGSIVQMAIGITVAAFIRPWLAMIFILPLGVLFMFGRIGLIMKILVLTMTVAGLVFSVGEFADQFTIETTQDLVETADSLSEVFSGGGSAQEVGGFSSAGGMLAFVPWGAFTALLRPLPGEVMNLFGILAGLENGVLLWMILIAIKRSNLVRLTEPVVAWVVATIILWAAVYSFVSYGNLGTAVRFKLQVMPQFLLVVLYLLDRSGVHAGGAAWIRPSGHSRR